MEIVNGKIVFSFVETQPYETIDIIIKKPLIDRIFDGIKDWLNVIAAILMIVASVVGVVKYLKSRKKKPESSIKSKKKKQRKRR